MQRLSCEQVYNLWISEPNLIRIIDVRSRDAYERQHIPGAIQATAESLPAVLWEHKNRLIVLFSEEPLTPALEAVCGEDCVLMSKSLEWFDLGWPSGGPRRAEKKPQGTQEKAPEILFERIDDQQTEAQSWLLIDHDAREFCLLDAHDAVKPRCQELKDRGYQLCLLFRSQHAAQDLDYELSAAYKARICVPRNLADANTDIPLEAGQELLFGERLIRVFEDGNEVDSQRLGFEFCGRTLRVEGAFS